LRWRNRKLIAGCFVEFNGQAVASLKKGFQNDGGTGPSAARVNRHTLRRPATPFSNILDNPGSDLPRQGDPVLGHGNCRHPQPRARSGAVQRAADVADREERARPGVLDLERLRPAT